MSLIRARKNKVLCTFIARLGDSTRDSNEEALRLKWIGLAIVIGSAVISNFGVNLQKRSHDRV